MRFHGNDFRSPGTSGGAVRQMLRNQQGKKPSSSTGAGKQKKGLNCKTSPPKRYWLTSPKAHLQKNFREQVVGHLRKAGTCDKIPSACVV